MIYNITYHDFNNAEFMYLGIKLIKLECRVEEKNKIVSQILRSYLLRWLNFIQFYDIVQKVNRKILFLKVEKYTSVLEMYTRFRLCILVIWIANYSLKK